MLPQIGFRSKLSTRDAMYEQIKKQLEQQNAKLMKQREGLQIDGQNIPESTPQMVQQSPIGKKPSKIQEIYNKITEIISLCNSSENLTQIANAQKHILTYLSCCQSPESQDLELEWKKNTEHKQKRSHKSMKAKEDIEGKGLQLGDDIISIIESIQRRALIEIQNLRIDKIQLLKRLNEEIKLSNFLRGSKLMNSHPANQTNQDPLKNLQKIEEVNQQYLKSSEKERSRSNRLSQGRDSIRTAKSIDSSQRSPSFNRNLMKSYDEVTYGLTPMYRPPGKLVQSVEIHEENFPRLSKTDILRIDSEKQINGAKTDIGQMQLQIENLKMQNMKIRKNLSKNKMVSESPYKYQLRDQLRELQERAQHYQQVMANSRQPQAQNNSEFQKLLLTGASLMDQGRRLIKVKSNPSFALRQERTERSPSSSPYIML